MIQSITTANRVELNRRELIAFAFVEEAYARTGDLVAGLLPLFAPVLAKKAGRRFDPGEFAADVQRAYDIPMSPLVASGLVEKLAEAGLLALNEGDSHTYRINVEVPATDSLDDRSADALLAEFAEFANASLERIGLRQNQDFLDTAFLQRLTSAQFLNCTDKREKNYYRGKTLSLKKVEDDEQDAVHIEQALDVLCAEFSLRTLESEGASADLLTRLITGSVIAEVVLTLQTPSSSEVLSRLTVAFDGPLILDYLDLSTPELCDYAKDLFDVVDRAAIRRVVFKHTVEEMKGTLRGPLEALQRGDQPFGPLGNRIRTSSSHAAYARAALADLDQRVEALGFSIVDADQLSTTAGMKFCDSDTEESLRNNVGPIMEGLERRIRDAHSIATILRVREDAQSARSIADAKWILVTRNDAVARRSQGFLVVRKLIDRDSVPPAIADRTLAGYLWFAVGGNLGVLSRKKLVANCSYVVSPRTDVVSKVRQYLTELDPEKANLFMTLMRDQRAQRCLVHSTLGFPSAITPDNAELLLEDIRLSVAAEVSADAERREAEQRRAHEAQLEEIRKKHQDETLARESELLGLKGRLGDQVVSANEEIEQRMRERDEIAQRLRNVEATAESDIDSRVSRAAGSASHAALILRFVFIVGYLSLVGLTYWLTADVTPDSRVFALGATMLVAFVGFWIIPQFLYEKVAGALWNARFLSRCHDLGVQGHLNRFDVDVRNRCVLKKE